MTGLFSRPAGEAAPAGAEPIGPGSILTSTDMPRRGLALLDDAPTGKATAAAAELAGVAEAFAGAIDAARQTRALAGTAPVLGPRNPIDVMASAHAGGELANLLPGLRN